MELTTKQKLILDFTKNSEKPVSIEEISTFLNSETGKTRSAVNRLVRLQFLKRIPYKEQQKLKSWGKTRTIERSKYILKGNPKQGQLT